MSARGLRGGRRAAGEDQRALGLTDRVGGLSLRQVRGAVRRAAVQYPPERRWPAAQRRCGRCGLPVLLALTSRSRGLYVDPYPRPGGTIELRHEAGEELPSATVLPSSEAVRMAHHGGTCAQQRRQRPPIWDLWE